MARSRFRAGAFWGSRQENIDECADRIGEFLKRVAECSPVLANWYRTGFSRSEALGAPAVRGDDRHVIVALLEKGRNRRDDTDEPIADLGFHVGLWNGHEGELGASLDMQCGCYCDIFRNRVVMDVPVVKELGTRGVVALVVAMAEVWEPDWAGVFSDSSWERRDRSLIEPIVDRVIFILATLSIELARCREGLGSLILRDVARSL